MSIQTRLRLCVVVLAICIGAISAVPLYSHWNNAPLPYGAAMHGLTNQKSAESSADRGRHVRSLLESKSGSSAPTTGALVGCAASGQYSVEMFFNEQGPFRLQLDTGSAHLAIVSTLCQSTNECGDASLNPRVNVHLPGIVPLSNAVRHIVYANGSYFGYMYQSNVSIDIGKNMTAPYTTSISGLPANTSFLAISNSTDFFYQINCQSDTLADDDYYQGIAGFAFPIQGNAWITDYFAQYPLVSQEFTIQLCPVDDGRLWIGYYNATSTTTHGEFECVPVLDYGFWGGQACAMDFSNNSSGKPIISSVATFADFGSCNNSFFQNCSVFDSGTSQILLPLHIYNNFVYALRNDSYYISVFGTANDPYDPTNNQCVTTDVSAEELQRYLPVLTLIMGTAITNTTDGPANCATNLSLPISGIDGYLTRVLNGSHSQPCYVPAVAPYPIYPVSIFGDAFLQAYTVRHIMNQSTSRGSHICFAPSAGCQNFVAPSKHYPSHHHSPSLSSASAAASRMTMVLPMSSVHSGSGAALSIILCSFCAVITLCVLLVTRMRIDGLRHHNVIFTASAVMTALPANTEHQPLLSSQFGHFGTYM